MAVEGHDTLVGLAEEAIDVALNEVAGGGMLFDMFPLCELFLRTYLTFCILMSGYHLCIQ